MWKRNFLANTFRGHDGSNAGWTNSDGQRPTGHGVPTGAREAPGARNGSSFGGPLNLFQGPLIRSRPASGYEPEWCRA